LGNLVQTVIDEQLAEGKYKAEINSALLNSGIYFCTLQLDELAYSTKLIKH
jgi:hypothetical protein